MNSKENTNLEKISDYGPNDGSTKEKLRSSEKANVRDEIAARLKQGIEAIKGNLEGQSDAERRQLQSEEESRIIQKIYKNI